MINRILVISAFVTCLYIPPVAVGQQATPQGPSNLADLRSIYDSALAKINEAGLKEQETVVNAYLEALSKSKAKLQATGKLGRVAIIKEEIEKVTQRGGVTANKDPELDKPRKDYLDAKGVAATQEKEKIAALQLAYVARLQGLEKELTKAGTIEEVVAVRKERELIQSGADVPGPPKIAVVKADDNIVEPPVANNNPFRLTTWATPMTIPPGVYTMAKDISVVLPDAIKNSLSVVFTKGTSVVGGRVQLYFGHSQVIARETSFSGILLRGNFNSRMTFQGCTLNSCTIDKEGRITNKTNFHSKWKFEQCVIDRSFLDTFKIKHVGIDISDCTIKNLTLPSIEFGQGDLAEVILSEWLQVRRTRFEKCKIPLSFLLITEGCSFVECTLVPDRPSLPLSKQLVVTLYEDKCVSRIKESPVNVLINERPLKELPNP